MQFLEWDKVAVLAIPDAGIKQVLTETIGNGAQRQAIVYQYIQRDRFWQAQ